MSLIRSSLSNLFAFYDRDIAVVDEVSRDLKQSGEFASVWRPAPRWVAAARPLPDSEPDGEAVRVSGLLFAEGREQVLSSFAGDPLEGLVDTCRMADQAPEQLQSLPGDFGFLRFREDGATAVRSCGGLVPFYVRSGGGRIVVSTRLGDHVRFCPEEVEVDGLTLAIWISGFTYFPDNRSFLKGVSVVPRGGFVELRPSQEPLFGTYWKPRPSELPIPDQKLIREHSLRLRELLLEKLACDLDPEGRNLLALSGGVDSSSLAALATTVLRFRTATWSILPGRESLYRHEMSFIAPLWDTCGIRQKWVMRHDAQKIWPAFESDPPAVFVMIHPGLRLLPALQREVPVRVLFGGEFADELCGSVYTFPDYKTHLRLPDLWRRRRELPTGRQTVPGWVKHHLQRRLRRPRIHLPSAAPDIVRDSVKREYQDWHSRLRRQLAEDEGPKPYFEFCSKADGFTAMNWEAASGLGIRRSFPFFFREVLELGWQCHPGELVGPVTKKLLRSAVENDVPHQNLSRADKGSWGQNSGNLKVQLPSAEASTMDVLGSVIQPEVWSSGTKHIWALTFALELGNSILRRRVRPDIRDLNQRDVSCSLFQRAV